MATILSWLFQLTFEWIKRNVADAAADNQRLKYFKRTSKNRIARDAPRKNFPRV
jgi:hypothetical protein